MNVPKAQRPLVAKRYRQAYYDQRPDNKRTEKEDEKAKASQNQKKCQPTHKAKSFARKRVNGIKVTIISKFYRLIQL